MSIDKMWTKAWQTFITRNRAAWSKFEWPFYKCLCLCTIHSLTHRHNSKVILMDHLHSENFCVQFAGRVTNRQHTPCPSMSIPRLFFVFFHHFFFQLQPLCGPCTTLLPHPHSANSNCNFSLEKKFRNIFKLFKIGLLLLSFFFFWNILFVSQVVLKYSSVSQIF